LRFHCNPHEIFKIWKLQATYHAHDCAHMAATTTTLSARFKDAYEPLFSNSSSLPVWTDDDSRLFESFQYPQTLEKNGSFVAKFAFSFKNAYQFLQFYWPFNNIFLLFVGVDGGSVFTLAQIIAIEKCSNFCDYYQRWTLPLQSVILDSGEFRDYKELLVTFPKLTKDEEENIPEFFRAVRSVRIAQSTANDDMRQMTMIPWKPLQKVIYHAGRNLFDDQIVWVLAFHGETEILACYWPWLPPYKISCGDVDVYEWEHEEQKITDIFSIWHLPMQQFRQMQRSAKKLAVDWDGLETRMLIPMKIVSRDTISIHEQPQELTHKFIILYR